MCWQRFKVTFRNHLDTKVCHQWLLQPHGSSGVFYFIYVFFFYFSFGICKCCNAICFGLPLLPCYFCLRLFVVRFWFFSFTNKSRRSVRWLHDAFVCIAWLWKAKKAVVADSRPETICWLPLTSCRDSEWNIRSHHHTWEPIFRAICYFHYCVFLHPLWSIAGT